MALEQLSEQHLTKLLNINCYPPIPLQAADLSIPFIYDRRFGVMVCDSGYHQQAMATLYSFDQDVDSPYKLFGGSTKSLYDLSDKWLSQVGTAFKSGVGRQNMIYAGLSGNLNYMERIRFGAVYYLLNDDNQ